MPAVAIAASDLTPFGMSDDARTAAMIEDALAMAARVAPCIITAEFTFDAAAKAILRGAILRWNEAGTGALSAQSAGPFSQTVDTRQVRRGMFWPSEIEELQKLCRGDEASGAFAIDTLGTATVHAEICALNFGANYCSCGADLAGFPLFEV